MKANQSILLASVSIIALVSVAGWFFERKHSANVVRAYEKSADIVCAGHVVTTVAVLDKIQKGSIRDAVNELEQSLHADIAFMEASGDESINNRQQEIEHALTAASTYLEKK